MNKFVPNIWILIAIILLCPGASFAQDAVEPVAPEMSEQEKAMMANMQAYSTPNENHAFLATLAGTWKAEVKHWMTANAQPETSEGTTVANMIYGGRFLEQNFSGTMMGQPFEGRGIYGYDNIQRKIQGIWFDNIGTGVMTSKGIYEPETRMISEEGSMSCPMTNAERSFRSVTTVVDADHYTFETFMKDEEGNEFRSMLITYTRTQ